MPFGGDGGCAPTFPQQYSAEQLLDFSQPAVTSAEPRSVRRYLWFRSANNRIDHGFASNSRMFVEFVMRHQAEAQFANAQDIQLALRNTNLTLDKSHSLRAAGDGDEQDEQMPLRTK